MEVVLILGVTALGWVIGRAIFDRRARKRLARERCAQAPYTTTSPAVYASACDGAKS